MKPRTTRLPGLEDRALRAFEAGYVATERELVVACTAILASRFFRGLKPADGASDSQWQRMRGALAKYRADLTIGLLISQTGIDFTAHVDPSEMRHIKASFDVLVDLVICDVS